MKTTKLSWEPEELKYLVDNYVNMTCREIGLKLGRTTRAVRHKFRELKLKKPQAKIGDIINGWKIVEIYQEFTGKQNISYANVVSTLGDNKVGRYKLTQLTKGNVGWPDRRRPDNIERNRLSGKSNGLYGHRLYSIWTGMKNRCYNRNQSSYKNYGARGICICLEWLNDFLCFYEWSINNGYKDDLTIDRIDKNGNYEPSNCQWSNFRTQINNRTISINIAAFGEIKNASDWSLDDRCKCSYNTLIYRIKKGWDTEKALTKPSKTLDNFRRFKSFYFYVKKNHPEILEQFSERVYN